MSGGGRIADVLVVGGGITGLTAAWHCALRGLGTELLEPGLAGGQVLNVGRLDGYPSPAPVSGGELASALQVELERLGVRVIAEQAAGLEPGPPHVVWTDAGRHRARYLICATGARLAPLQVPGAERLWQRGISQCAFCDAGLYRGQPVVVAGGGDAALQEALHLVGFASKVTLVHRGRRLRARLDYVERAAECENLEFLWGAEIISIEGECSVTGLRIRKRAASGGVVEELAIGCRAVFPFFGQIPNSEWTGRALSADPSGRIRVGADLSATVAGGAAGIYAAGAVRAGYGGLLTNAVSDASSVAAAVAERA